MAIKLIGATSGILADVDANTQLKVTLNPTGTLAGYAKAANDNGQSFGVGLNGRMRVSHAHQTFCDMIDASNVNTNLWNQSVSGMTIVQGSSVVTLNSAASTTNANYAIMTSVKNIQRYADFPLSIIFKAKLIFPAANGVIELGRGNVATNATPTDGVFFRVNASGNLIGVVNFNGVETVSATICTISTADFYTFEIVVGGEQAIFIVKSAATSSTTIYADPDQTIIGYAILPAPATQASVTTNSRLPVAIRVYNSGTPGSAPQAVIGFVGCNQMDLQMVRPWAHTKASESLGAVQSPVTTFSQSQGWSNTAAPVNFSLSNTATAGSLYNDLGGLFNFSAPATSATDGIVFGFQVPAGFQFYITEVFISATSQGAAVATTPTTLAWALAVNASAVSLATADGAGTWQPRRFGLGITTWVVAALVGTAANDINRHFDTPVVCEGGRWIHILVKPLVGTATASQTIQGLVTINGYWE